jgi:hypothetical protein
VLGLPIGQHISCRFACLFRFTSHGVESVCYFSVSRSELDAVL